MKHSTIHKIAYLNGKRFQRGLLAGARCLIQNYEYLNNINVFPVADGDTGSNMAGTVRSIASEWPTEDYSIGNVAKAMAESFLMSARGNSGAILAQFMCGFSESVKGLTRISPPDFISAAVCAAKKAKEAMAHPKEGTIISVIQDWVEHLRENAHHYYDFIHLLEDSIKRARISLNETPRKLAVLKSANVVDAGAQGFIYLLEGILNFTHEGSLASKADSTSEYKSIEEVKKHYIEQEILFTYCVECLVERITGNKQSLRKQLEVVGDSLIVVGTTDMLRVHIHTNDPDSVFSLVGTYGSIVQRKVENMQEQHSELYGDVIPVEKNFGFVHSDLQKVGIVTDSTCDLPQEQIDRLGISVVPLRLFLDQEEYIDKVNLSTLEFNARLVTSKSATTSQPIPYDFQQAYEKQLAWYEDVLSLHVMGIYSGSYQSALNVSRQFNNHVHVLDSYTLTAGLGLLVSSAAQYAKKGMSIDEIIKAVSHNRENTRVFVSLDTLDFAVRGGRISKKEAFIGNLLHVKPILEFSTRQQGRIQVVSKKLGSRSAEKSLLNYVFSDVRQMKNVRFAITHVGAPKVAERYANVLQDIYDTQVEYIMDASAVLSVHGGPGACAVCFLGTS